MSYCDPRKQTEIIVDASPVGLSGLLTQEGKVLSYASRALSDVERRYSQIEREMLAARGLGCRTFSPVCLWSSVFYYH